MLLRDRRTTCCKYRSTLAPHWLHMSQVSRHSRAKNMRFSPTVKIFEFSSRSTSAIVARCLRHVEPVWSDTCDMWCVCRHPWHSVGPPKALNRRSMVEGSSARCGEENTGGYIYSHANDTAYWGRVEEKT